MSGTGAIGTARCLTCERRYKVRATTTISEAMAGQVRLFRHGVPGQGAGVVCAGTLGASDSFAALPGAAGVAVLARLALRRVAP